MPGSNSAVSVNVIIHDDQGSVLLLRRASQATLHPGKWEFPGGIVDSARPFEQAVLDVVRERAGVPIDSLRDFGTCGRKHPDEPFVYVIMEGRAQATAVKLTAEHSRFEWVSPDQLDDWALCPQFRRIARQYAQDVRREPRVKVPDRPTKPEPWACSVVRPESLEEHLDAFLSKDECDVRQSMANWLREYLTRKVKTSFPLADVGARAKDSVSFAGKLIKKNKYKRPLQEVTDLVGARVVLHLPEEVEAVCRMIEREFEIDRANSIDKLKELTPDRFGYRSVHYVVELHADKPDGVPAKLVGRKAEIQVRTIAQHAWSDIGHDRLYKSDCGVPEYWQRESSRIAALLEAADEAFARLVRGVSAFQSYSRHETDRSRVDEQLQLWDVVRAKLPEAPPPALKAVQLAEDLSNWDKVIAIVDEYKGAPNARLLGAKGHALCKRGSEKRNDDWWQGLKTMEDAIALASYDTVPHLRLAELLAPDDPSKALPHYAAAFAIDPSNPAILVGYIRCKVLQEKSAAFIPLLKPDIERAIKRSRELADLGADLPNALYRLAGFHLLLGSEHHRTSIDLFARAVHETTLDSYPLVRALRDVSQLAEHTRERQDIECARRFLAAALMARFPGKWPTEARPPITDPLKPKGQVVIVAGGCDAHHAAAVQSYEGVLREAFKDFRGTIISGGTREGISGLVGALAAESGGRIEAVAYHCEPPPYDSTATKDNRYQFRKTDGAAGFTSRQPIQCWLDLLAAGVRPNDVRVLGINGGNIAGLEYRIAIALGAIVGVIEGSGREAETVVNDWPGVSSLKPRSTEEIERGIAHKSARGKLVPLPCDAATLRALLYMGIEKPATLNDAEIDAIAQSIHRDFLEQNRYSAADPAMQPWDRLRPDLKESNRSQAEYMLLVLNRSGFEVTPCAGPPVDPEFSDDEVQLMGQEEHGRWNFERLLSGWRHGKTKDANKRLSPYIAPWKSPALTEAVRGYDYKNVRLWAETLAEHKKKICRRAKAPATTSSPVPPRSPR